MIARLARFDPLVMDEVHHRVRMRDGLEAFIHLLREEAASDFRHEQLMYVQGGLKKQPKLPAILKDRPRTRPSTEPFKAPEKPRFLEALEDVESARRRR